MTKKAQDPSNPRPLEIESLSVRDLDVHELERRLELATLTAQEEGCWSFSCQKYSPPPGT